MVYFRKNRGRGKGGGSNKEFFIKALQSGEFKWWGPAQLVGYMVNMKHARHYWSSSVNGHYQLGLLLGSEKLNRDCQ